MIIGTRGSGLALAQTNLIASMLEERGVETTKLIIKTTGDSFTDRPLHEVEGVGAFVREIDDWMLAGKIDLAVHSMKDLPTERPEELSIAGVLKRDSPFDVLLTNDGSTLDELSYGAVIGTTSMRRRAQLLRYRPDLNIQDLRGNIDTRIRKLKDGLYDGIMLAEAGLQRMGWKMDVERLNPDSFCPSANQGTIVIVTRADTEAEGVAFELDHAPTRMETRIERLVINEVGGGCIVPVGAYAEVLKSGDEIHVRAEVLALDGSREVGVDEVIPVEGYREHAIQLGQEMVRNGGRELVQDAVCQLADTQN
ncbi:MAG: hydroxymethylbilane synthase [Methanosarcinaceae archaeon]|nr:hydroxymethylbilane synthase [Methanosarcinaceae archaeon]